MRYDGLRKLARNRQLVKFKEDNPGLSLKEIGAAFGISYARVSVILKKDRENKSKAV